MLCSASTAIHSISGGPNRCWIVSIAARGIFFEPNIGLLLQNYIENKDRYLGIGNFTESGFALMERGVPQSLAMFKRVKG